jgi:hypothetical protein
MSEPKTVVVLGGGVGGVVTARELRKRLARQHRVVLINREREHVFAPSLLWLMVGLRRAEAIKRPLSRLERKGIDVRLGEVEKIDPEARSVTVGGEPIAADYLVVSLGAELEPETIPGLQEAGHNFYTLPGAERLRDALSSLERGRIVILTAAPAYKCPAAPYEAALLVDHFLRERGRRDKVTIDVYAAEPGPMGVAGPDVSAAVKQMLEAKGIPYHPEHQVKAADAAAKRLDFANGSARSSICSRTFHRIAHLVLFARAGSPPRAVGSPSTGTPSRRASLASTRGAQAAHRPPTSGTALASRQGALREVVAALQAVEVASPSTNTRELRLRSTFKGVSRGSRAARSSKARPRLARRRALPCHEGATRARPRSFSRWAWRPRRRSAPCALRSAAARPLSPAAPFATRAPTPLAARDERPVTPGQRAA